MVGSMLSSISSSPSFRHLFRCWEELGFLFWIMKDCMWVLYVPILSWAAFVASLGLEIASIARRWSMNPWVLRGNSSVAVFWLSGNAIWMSSNFLFEDPSPGAVLLGFDRPLLGHSESGSSTFLLVARFMFFLAISTYLLIRCAAVQMTWKSSGGNMSRMALWIFSGGSVIDADAILTNLYMDAWIGAWVLKDLFWTYGLFVPGFLSAVLAMTLIGRSFRRSKSQLVGAEMLWLIGNIIWFVAEVRFDDPARWPHLVSALLYFVTASIYVLGLTNGIGGGESRRHEEMTKPCERGRIFDNPGQTYT
eukprot:TRINITY_DN64222_c0_g1_i1.p1 TRINITY_DN64222_c0_g1~~TRINITY_DN64222_c0_g1_i1.p1  ORF type:complete len:306 (-),score=38.11 TRINITY_DN64222_c0_g1_i1:116-1033(-)